MTRVTQRVRLDAIYSIKGVFPNISSRFVYIFLLTPVTLHIHKALFLQPVFVPSSISSIIHNDYRSHTLEAGTIAAIASSKFVLVHRD